MYGKVFSSMFQGSLYGQWEAIVTFTMMIVLADREGEVDMTPEALSAQTSIPLEIIKRGITSLEAPDPQSRTPDEEGRRIVRVSDTRDWGWTITNYQHYREIRSAEERREYFRQHKQKQRDEAKALSTVQLPKSTVSTARPHKSTMSTKVEAVSSKQREETTLSDFEEAWSKYPTRPNNSRGKALRAWSARIADGEAPNRMLRGVEAYAAYVKREETEPHYIKQAATFFGPDKPYADDYGDPENNGEIRVYNADGTFNKAFLKATGMKPPADA